MAGAWRALLTAALVLILFTTAGGRSPTAPAISSTPSTPTPAVDSGASAPPSVSSTSPPPPSGSAPSAAISATHSLAATQLRGCVPKAVVHELAIKCRQPHLTAPIPNGECCAVAVAMVARPSCFCLVQKVPLFGMSPVFDRSVLEALLQKCGAFPLLSRVLDDPCGHAYADGCAVPAKEPVPAKTPTGSAGCLAYQVATIVGWSFVTVLVAAVILLWFWRPTSDMDGYGEDREGCRCTTVKCRKRTCRCNKGKKGCTPACQCRGCSNPYGVRRAPAAREMEDAEGERARLQ